MLGEPDEVVADDLLDFAGVAPPRLFLYPVETHLAEKLHAYTLPRLRPNTRVKDLPDLVLLATTRDLDAQRVRQALEMTYPSSEPRRDLRRSASYCWSGCAPWSASTTPRKTLAARRC